MNHIYIHVPFCAKRCIYCDFYSTTLSEEIKELYVEKAIEELAERKEFMPRGEVQTLYFGGGTPSQLSIAQIERIMQAVSKHYPLIDDAEITLEANPDDVTPEWCDAIKLIGINRVSLGVQSFNDQILQMLNRRHSAEQAMEAVERLHRAGISNISIDLIYGLPQQSEQQFEMDLKLAFALPITHLSSYALSIEEGTALAKKIANGELKVTDEQTYAKEYELLMQHAKENGFVHYEISNFSLPLYESKHNSGYWDGTPYLGVGPGAHSYNGERVRQYNIPNLKDYINKSSIPTETELLTDEELFNETVFTSLRTSRGLALDSLKEKFTISWQTELIQAAQPHILNGHLEIRDNHLRLTHKAIIISDSIISDLMRV